MHRSKNTLNIMKNTLFGYGSRLVMPSSSKSKYGVSVSISFFQTKMYNKLRKITNKLACYVPWNIISITNTISIWKKTLSMTEYSLNSNIRSTDIIHFLVLSNYFLLILFNFIESFYQMKQNHKFLSIRHISIIFKELHVFWI